MLAAFEKFEIDHSNNNKKKNRRWGEIEDRNARKSESILAMVWNKMECVFSFLKKCRKFKMMLYYHPRMR